MIAVIIKCQKEVSMVMILKYILKPVEEGTKLTYMMDYEMPRGIPVKTVLKRFEKHSGETDTHWNGTNGKGVNVC